MATLDSNKVTDVSVVSSATDAVNKQYIDELIPSTAGNAGEFLAVYPGAAYWILRTSGFDSNSNIRSLGYGGEIYVAAGGSTNVSIITTSTNAIVWTLRTFSFASQIFAFTYANNTYIVGGASAVLGTSTDAIAWTLRTSNQSFFITISDIIFGGSLYAAVGIQGSSSSALITSTDTITWTRRTSNAGVVGFNKIGYVGNNYVITATDGSIRISTDAITWQLRTSGITSELIPVIYKNNTYIVALLP